MTRVTILVTGSAGFIGKHLMEALSRRPDVRVFGYDVGSTAEELARALAEAEVIYHLAGVNRPRNPSEYQTGNAGFTQALCASLEALGRKPTIVLSSSIQAELDNPYGISKRQAERVLQVWSERTGGRCVIFRLRNVFGKWCRPNYNSVVATFCHNIAHELPISISDPNKELELVYIDDVVAALTAVLDEGSRASDGRPADSGHGSYREVPRSFRIGLGALAEKIRSFRQSRQSLRLPSFADDFSRCLYATYLSYLEPADFAYNLDRKTDDRGYLAEFMKSEHFGQLFLSRTKPGITRGNHYHHTKAEKFLVVEGEAVIRFRSINPENSGGGTRDGGRRTEVIEHRISGKDFRVVDIPPGYTHSIENVGKAEMVVLFWASEIFDPQKPDTVGLTVLGEGGVQMTECGGQRAESRTEPDPGPSSRLRMESL